jgi:hypothetical protein
MGKKTGEKKRIRFSGLEDAEDYHADRIIDIRF